MVFDHLFVVLDGSTWSPLRVITRPSMPAFALLLGALATHRLSRRRWLEWAAVVIAAPQLYLLAGVNGPGLMLWLALGRFLAVGVGREAGRVVAAVSTVVVLTAMANGVQPDTLPGEYVPIMVIGLVVLGRFIGPRPLSAVGAHLPAWLAWVGRRPMTWYLGHLAVLAVIF